MKIISIKRKSCIMPTISGNLYLSKARAKEIWETLVDSPRALVFDKEKCCDFFRECLQDLVNETQKEFFNQKLLLRPPTTVTSSAFQCFRDYFESVNASDGKIRKNFSTSLIVESLQLNGYDYLWKLVTSATDEKVAQDITEYLLKVSFIDTSAKLKKEAHELHKQFIDRCFSQLTAVTETAAAISTSKMSSTVALVQQGYELETCTEESAFTRLRNRSAAGDGEPSSFLHDNPGEQRTQIIRRLINLLERYVSVVEEAHPGKRQIPSHATTFLGQPLTLKVTKNDSKKEELEVQCHSNEMIGALKKIVAEKLQQTVGDLTFESSVFHGTLGTNKDGVLIGSLLKNDKVDTWSVTVNLTSSSTALMVFDDNADFETDKNSHKHMLEEQEKNLPGVMMSNDPLVFPTLYKLSATSKDSATLTTLSKLFHKIPTDTNVIEEFESIGQRIIH